MGDHTHAPRQGNDDDEPTTSPDGEGPDRQPRRVCPECGDPFEGEAVLCSGCRPTMDAPQPTGGE